MCSFKKKHLKKSILVKELYNWCEKLEVQKHNDVFYFHLWWPMIFANVTCYPWLDLKTGWKPSQERGVISSRKHQMQDWEPGGFESDFICHLWQLYRNEHAYVKMGFWWRECVCIHHWVTKSQKKYMKYHKYNFRIRMK